MKKTAFIILFFLFIVVFLVLNKKNFCLNKKAKVYKINNKAYCLLISSNSKQWERGLMFYKKPVDFDGMIFVFPNKKIRSFWNKNTYLDLDVYWMDEDTVIGKSYLPSILKSKKIITVNSEKKVNKVVEIIF